jgi:hypothetical protein
LRQVSRDAPNGHHHRVDGISTHINDALHRDVWLNAPGQRDGAVTSGGESPERFTDVTEALAHTASTQRQKIRARVDTQSCQQLNGVSCSVSHRDRNGPQGAM